MVLSQVLYGFCEERRGLKRDFFRDGREERDVETGDKTVDGLAFHSLRFIVNMRSTRLEH
jgi:hypothetical protein